MPARIGAEHRAMARGWVLSVLACLATADANAAPSAAADVVIRNARIYTVDEAQPWASSMAIRGKHIVAVGGDRQTRALTGRRTRVIDLGGRLVLPAFHDAHAHPLAGGLTHSQCPLYSGNSVADYRRLIAACLAEQPGTGWVYGVGWRDGMFPPEGVPTKDLLDDIAPDRPVAFGSTGEHSLWVNSRALQLAGITRDTPDPPNGRIDRDARGEPVGALQEAAMSLVFDLLPPPSEKAREGALRYGLDYYHRMGIVGWHDASVPVSATDPLQTIQTYAALHRQGQLRAHVVLALTWDNARGLEQLGDIQSAAQRATALGLTARTVKFFIDGVLAQRSAALLEPYADQAGFRGDLQIEEQVFQEAIAQLDARGFQVHVHAIGDRAVRASLDAFASAQQRNGKNDNRHLLAHVNLIADDDLARFAALGVVAVFQPLWARLDDYMRMTGVRVGPERLERMYPAASLIHAGATVAYGSDWPVASANPLEGIEVALTRRQPGASDGERLAANQRLSLEQAIRGYTINSAYASHKDDVSGSIQNGKSADVVVLDRDLFHVPVHEIGRTQVLLTMLAGEIVHDELGAELSRQRAHQRGNVSAPAE